ncbi:hypothetical protein [Cetobacterium sp.]|uniref:hypothetical protein n=1 Tax=Cetobacterium sp. TaxID=2071632 RepID=UPI003EE4B9A9
MYINTKHLQILHLIKNNPNFDLSDISEILNMSQQHIKLHLKDIYEEISEKNIFSMKVDQMLKDILNSKNAKNIKKITTIHKKSKNFLFFIFS